MSKKNMNKNKIITLKCIMMSAGMGLLMGASFSIINQMKQNGQLNLIGILVGMAMSCVVSILVGLVFNMKKICDFLLGRGLRLNTFESGKKIAFYICESIIGSIIFTPFNMFFNQLYGMYMGMQMGNTFPPYAVDFLSKIKFISTGPFGPAYGSAIIPSILIGIPISLVGTLIFGKISDKICGI